jgi:hypothetical protein
MEVMDSGQLLILKIRTLVYAESQYGGMSDMTGIAVSN